MSFAGLTTPLFSALFGWIFHSEIPTASFYLSFFIVFSGLFLFYQEELSRQPALGRTRHMTATKSRINSINPKKGKAAERASQGPFQDSKLNASVLACFQEIVKRELLFHSIFPAIGGLLLVGFHLSSFLADSFLMGIFIAVTFFTTVLYFVLRLYFQDKKPARILQLRNEYLAQCNEQDPDLLAKRPTPLPKSSSRSKLPSIPCQNSLLS